MNIVNASPNHIDYISNLLSQYFSKANQFFEYTKYKDGFDIMRKHVSKRIENPGDGFIYLVAEDENGEPIGFINLLIDENNIGNILVTISDDKGVAKELVLKAVGYFKERGITNVQGEVFEYESDLKEIYSNIGIKNELLSFKLLI